MATMATPSARATSRSIYVFRHVVTSQTVYSTTASADSNSAMSQLPHGRRTRPVSLRRDHWEPLLCANFANQTDMRRVLARMHDYRRWRAALPSTARHAAPAPVTEDADTAPTAAASVAKSLPRKRAQRVKEAFDMTAHSVADLSSAIAALAGPGSAVEIDWLDVERRQHAAAWPSNVTHAQRIQLGKTNRFTIVRGDGAKGEQIEPPPTETVPAAESGRAAAQESLA